jgi:hypothetical protein
VLVLFGFNALDFSSDKGQNIYNRLGDWQINVSSDTEINVVAGKT